MWDGGEIVLCEALKHQSLLAGEKWLINTHIPRSWRELFFFFFKEYSSYITMAPVGEAVRDSSSYLSNDLCGLESWHVCRSWEDVFVTSVPAAPSQFLHQGIDPMKAEDMGREGRGLCKWTLSDGEARDTGWGILYTAWEPAPPPPACRALSSESWGSLWLVARGFLLIHTTLYTELRGFPPHVLTGPGDEENSWWSRI